MFPLIILAVILFLFGYGFVAYRKFDHQIKTEVNRLFSETLKAKPTIVTEAMLDGLPEPVKRYLRYTGVVGKSIPQTVRLKQRGKLRTNPARPWMNITAEEYYSINPPSFVWVASANQSGIPILRGRDLYRAGKGNMNIKLGSVVDVVNAVGEAIDQASMMRYLNEIIEFPAAFLCDNICFEAIDDHSAKVTLTDCGKTASATLFVDDEGKLTNFVAQRYYTADRLETWSTPITGYGEFEGLHLPIGGKAVWKLQAGDFEYVDVAIPDIQYDVASPY
jgi:hypothetical protein